MNDSVLVSTQSPWPGLNPFTESLQAYFHGRRSETDELVRRVKRRSLTVLFGQSGLGKTSLVQAGLFPRLRDEGILPLAVRLDYDAKAPPLAEQVLAELCRASASAEQADVSPPVAGESLWEYFHRRESAVRRTDGGALPVVLAFDQFEEYFTLGKAGSDAQGRGTAFLTQLADLIENRLPAALAERAEQDESLTGQFDFDRSEVRVLISLREDFLPHLESLRTMLPAVAENRFRLTQMKGNQALQAVLEPGGDLVAAEVGRQIVRFVAEGRAPEAAEAPVAAETPFDALEVEPAYLSLFCRELNDRRIARALPQITADLLAGSRDAIIQDFYERCVADQPLAVREFIEDELLSDSGYRESMSLERARKELLRRGAPAEAIDTLVRRRLLHIEDRLHNQRVELTHDLLVDVIKSSRARRQQLAAAQASLRDWFRKHRALVGTAIAGAAALVAAISVAVALLVTNAWQHEKAARQDAEKNEEQLEVARDEAVMSENQAKNLENQAKKLADANAKLAATEKQSRTLADEQSKLAQTQRELAQRLQYAADINLANQAFQENRPFRMRELLLAHKPSDQSPNFAWSYLWQLCQAKVVLGPEHQSACRAVVFSPDGRRAASSGSDGIVSICNAETGVELLRLPPPHPTCNAIAYSPDGAMLAAASYNDKVRVCNALTAALLYTVDNATGSINGLTFSPDGKRLALAATNDTVVVCDAKSGKLQYALTGHSGPINGLAFSPDSKTLASCSDDKTVRLWNIETGKPSHTLEGHASAVMAAAFSPDGKLLASADASSSMIIVWDLSTFQPSKKYTEHSLQVTGVAFSPDGRQLVSASADGTARIRTLGSDKPATILYGPGGLLFGGSVSSDGTRLALGGDDGSVQLWDLTVDNYTQVTGWTTGKDESLFISQSADGKQIAKGNSNGEVVIWDTTGKKLQTLTGLSGGVQGVAFSPDGKSLVAGGDGMVAKVWDVASGKKITEYHGHKASIVPVAFHPQGRFVATADSQGVIKIWDPTDGRTLATLQQPNGNGVDGLAFSPDGRRLASSGLAKRLAIWDTSSWTTVRVWFDFSQGLNGVAYSPDGHYLATGLTDGAVVVQDEQRDDPMFTLRGHNGRAIGFAFSPDSRELAAGGYDTTIRIWDLTTGQPLIAMIDAFSTSLAFSSDGLRLTGGAPGIVGIWSGGAAAPAAARWLDWYRTQARDAHQAKQWFALAFDCDQMIKADPAGEAKYRRLRDWADDQQQQWEQLLSDTTKVMKLSTPTGEDFYYLGIAYFGLAQYQQAEANLTRAVTLDPKDELSWSARGESRARMRRWADAVADYSKALELYDKSEVDWRLRGIARAELGQWDLAAADFAQALDRDAQDRKDLSDAVVVQLGRGDLPAYRRACFRMYDRLSYSDDPLNWNTTSWECSLDSTDNVPPAKLVSLMDKAVAADPKEYAFRNTRGAVLYRAGRYADAVKQLTDAIAAESHGGAFEDWIYMAMAHFRLGHADQARDALKRAVALYDNGITPKDPKTSPVDWSIRVEWRLLRAEAEKLIPPAKS